MQILATRTELPEVVGALSSLSTFYEENTPQAQRRLRTTIEQHSLSINEQFLAAAEDVIKVRQLAALLRVLTHDIQLRFSTVYTVRATPGHRYNHRRIERASH